MLGELRKLGAIVGFIAVEQQAKERLERLSALRKIKPIDMTRLSQQVGNEKDTDDILNRFLNLR